MTRSVWSLALVVASVVAVSAGARAGLEPPPIDASTQNPVKPPVKSTKPNALLCGCASSRFLGPTLRPAVVGNGTHGAWLHGETHIAGFSNVDGKLIPAQVPFAVDVDERGTRGASRLVRLRATGEGAGEMAIMRRVEAQPRDVLAAMRMGRPVCWPRSQKWPCFSYPYGPSHRPRKAALGLLRPHFHG